MRQSRLSALKMIELMRAAASFDASLMLLLLILSAGRKISRLVHSRLMIALPMNRNTCRWACAMSAPSSRERWSMLNVWFSCCLRLRKPQADPLLVLGFVDARHGAWIWTEPSGSVLPCWVTLVVSQSRSCPLR